MITAERLVQIGGLTAFLLTLHWVYTRELREKYAMGWMLTASGLLVVGLFPRLVMAFARASRLAYPSAVLFVALAAIYVFSMGISVALTWQRRATVRLVQEVALLRLRLGQLEARVDSLSGDDAEAAPGPRPPAPAASLVYGGREFPGPQPLSMAASVSIPIPGSGAAVPAPEGEIV
jgi:hypothetical protein